MRNVRKNGNASSLGLAKLASSGLTLEDAKLLRIEELSGQQARSLNPSFKPLASLKLNYLGPDKKPIGDWPKAAPFYRLRYLEQADDFSAQTKHGGPRYVQPPNTAPVAYFPGNQDWKSIVDDTSQPIIITEGELKAAKACKEGFPTIGLGGVYAWRSFKLGLEWLPSMDLVTWPRRNVYLCFDSDYRTNPMVCAALAQLGDALHQRGAVVHMVCLPQLEGGEKTGLDDFLVSAGAKAKELFQQLLHEAELLGLSKPLWQFNQRYVYVRQPGLLVDQATGAKITPSAFRDHAESTRLYQERTLKDDGTIGYKPVSAAAAWLRWPLRAEVSRMTYEPGKPRLVPLEGGGCNYNLWPGWGVEPEEGDVEPFIQMIDHLFTGAEPEAKEWFLRWCAFPLQYPGTKLFSSAVIHGIRHGTGKSFVGYTLGRIYGKNFTEINQNDLHGNFNEWAESKQFVMGDDVTGSNKRQDADFLKKLITQRELRVNAKYVPTYVVPDCVNYLFTANQPDAFFLEDDDRRFFIHEVKVGPLSEEFYKEYELWLDSGGSKAIFHYLLKLEMGDFNPAAPAFRTQAKERMISRVRSDLGGWVRELVATPEHVLRIGTIKIAKDLFTSKELLNFYDPEGKTGTTANGLGRELARAGVEQVYGGQPVRAPDGSQGRFYIVRNQEKWLNASYTDVVKHLAESQTRKP